MSKIRFIIKRLSNPRVRRRLKIGLSLYGCIILLCLVFKIAYDIGYFNAEALKQEKNAQLPTTNPVLTTEKAKQIVAAALKEDPSNPQTLVIQLIDSNPHFAIIMIEKNKIKQIAYIIDMRLFFIGNLFNAEGYNLTEGMENQYDLKRENYNSGAVK
ncbi:hypothetical protein BCS42_11430 [Crenothrix sp. D3]|nr:hypothetical protein BCS42_11430 [Crenothrix sp. D3]